MSTGCPASGIIFLRPQEGKREEVRLDTITCDIVIFCLWKAPGDFTDVMNQLNAFLEKNLIDIRENVNGVLVAFFFWSAKKNEFVVIER
jgi:hypothetical protein